jgi:nitrilase
MDRTHFPKETPQFDKITEKAPEILANGGSCIAGPDGGWIVEPVVNEKTLIAETNDFNRFPKSYKTLMLPATIPVRM